MQSAIDQETAVGVAGFAGLLVVTSEDGSGIEERVLTLGADDYIVKPFDPALLLARVHAVFRRLRAAAA